MSGIDAIRAERERQCLDYGNDHDDAEHPNGELAAAAACYAYLARLPTILDRAEFISAAWPWERSEFTLSEERRMLVKAGALIVAEIDRLDRIQKPNNAEA